MFKNCRKEDLRIVALELGETVAEKVTIVELTEIIKENKYFKEDVEFVKELIQYTIEDRKKAEEDRKRAEEDRKKEAENRLREKELELELARLNVNSDNERTGAKGKEHCGFIQAADNLEHSIKKFWEIENVEIDSVKTSELDICEDHFKSTHSRDDQGRYTVAMPLKEDPSCLGESRQTAIQRLNSLWKRLSRDKEYLSLIEQQRPTSFTKRMVLSTIARIFDPLGLLGPIITWAKIFKQRLWLLELGWSDELPFKEEKE
ncbi:integrase catalytic domain-containing protein [Trichonephila clavipes]|nr:integrase catalytic domain-containing protein [Trichonephila clavipes]